MKARKKSFAARFVRVCIITILGLALVIGIVTGVTIAATANIINNENYTTLEPALPTKILDIKGRLITQFSSEENREIVPLRELPPHLINALITREDQSFYSHHGFTVKSIFRAVWGKITGQTLGGGSTLTQQLAGTLYANRSDYSFRRKLVELWWALQLERRWTKEEILNEYMNRMYFGAGTYGVEAASKFYFGHSAREVTLAESAILVIQLSSPAKYNPITNPANAKARSREVLDQMIKLGFATQEAADDSFNKYWDNFDYTRVATTAFFTRDDKAPWFSEYVRRELEGMLYGSQDMYRDGYIVNTTLDLDMQAAADEEMARGLKQANRQFEITNSVRLSQATLNYVPIVGMLRLMFNLSSLYSAGGNRIKTAVTNYYQDNINAVADVSALLFGLPSLKIITSSSYDRAKINREKTQVEGALITIENETGYIKAIVGGSKFDANNQLIRATQGRMPPGSSFKPLYYSAAIDSQKITEGTMIYDSPVVFYNEDGTPYIPLNYKGEWKGPVLVWYALAHSMNVPSLKILNMIGFDAAIQRAAALLDITDPEEIRQTFPRVYPLGLGIISANPLKMAHAYTVFANGGRSIKPIAIRSVEDRNGRIILDPEHDRQEERKQIERQIISPQNAAVMVDMLQRTVRSGTLAGWLKSGTLFTYTDKDGKKFTIPSAGKTGTTQNWSDAWTVGFTPYMTTAIWFGFDRPGNSLGVEQTGASLAGGVFANYMYKIHNGLGPKSFKRPPTGLVTVNVDALSGLLPTQYSSDGTETLLYLAGTEPATFDDTHGPGGRTSAFVNASVLDAGSSLDTSINLDIPNFEAATGAAASGQATNAPVSPSDANNNGNNGNTPAETLPEQSTQPVETPQSTPKVTPSSDDQNQNVLN